MKRILVRTGMAASLFWIGCLGEAVAQPEIPSGGLLHIESVGWKALSHRKDIETWRTIGTLDSSKVIFNLLLDKLAGTPARLWKDTLPPDAKDPAADFRPLIEDIIRRPAVIRVEGDTDHPAIAVAVQGASEREAPWLQHLQQVARAWNLPAGEAAAGQGAALWRVTLAGSKGILELRRHEDWIVLLAGQGTEGLWKTLTGRLKGKEGPSQLGKDGLLRIEADWPRLKPWTPFFADLPLLPMVLTFSADQEYVRTKGDFISDKPLKLVKEPWQIPTNYVSEPLVSFTAARGVRPMMASIPFLKNIGLRPIPNQWFVWGQKLLSGQTMIALPSENPEKQIVDIHQSMTTAVSELFNNHITGQIYYISNQFEIVWRGLPILLPFAKALRTNDHAYLISGLLPYVIKTNPPPPQLYQQILENDDLLYYDWEITQERLLQNRHFYQTFDIFAERQTIPMDSPMFLWLQDIHTHLGNSVTEITHAQPKRIELNRKSHLGLTGFEIVTLMRWFHTDAFPLGFPPQPDIQIPDRIKEMRQRQKQPSTVPNRPATP